MGKDAQKQRRRRWRTGLLYCVTGLGIFLLFIRTWDPIAKYRVAIVVVLVVLLAALSARDWRRLRAERLERRKRWGLSGRPVDKKQEQPR